jgi:AcrR family transcriptional regulator
MDLDDVEQVACAPGPPIALLLSCYGAAFDGSEDCLGERLLARPAGPIAVIGGTRVTMPYGMAVLSQRLMRQMFEEHATTLGQMLLEAKRQTLAPPGDSTQTPWLDALARAFSQKPDDLLDERREHVLMFHLLGDPLTRIRHAQPLEVDVPRVARAGQPLLVKCRCQVSGVCTVELTCRRGRLTFKPDARREFDGTHAGMQQLTRVYLRANDDRFASQQLQASTPEFTATLAVPQDVSGPCAVRVFVQGAEAFALGAAALYVAGPQPGNHEGGEAAQDVADAASPIANSP